MKLNKKRGWIALAVLSATLSPTDCFAQRGRDDADSYPAEARGASEPPRLMRGGIMQQLRSVTDSVIGPFEDKPAPSESRGNVPKPPALGQTRRMAEPRQGSVSQPRSGDGKNAAPSGNSSANNSAAGPADNGNGQGRDWAGQFLIPNYRLRDQVSGGALRSAMEARRNAREDVAEQGDGGRGQSEARGTRQPSVPTPPPLSPENNSTAPRRVYPGQSTAVKSRMSDPVDSDSQAMVLTNMSDLADEPAEEAPSEVAVSQVPDVPYVPRKPLPKRDASQLLEKSLASGGIQSSQAAPSATATPSKSSTVSSDKSKSSNASPTRIANSNSNSTSSSLSTSSSTPSSSVPSSSAGGTSSSSGTGNGNGNGTVMPLPPVPSVPSLEISNNLPAPPLPLAPGGSSKPSTLPMAPPSLPSSGLAASGPSASNLATSSDAPKPILDPVKARPISTPAGAPLPSGSMSGTSSGASSGSSNLSTNLSTNLPTTVPSLPGSALALPPAPAMTGSTPMAKSSALPPPPQLPTQTSMPAATAPVAPSTTPPAGGLAKPSSERMSMEIPHVAVKLLGPGDLNTNTPTSYELMVVNSDRIALSGLILRMETPPGVEVAPVGSAAASCESEKADDGATLLTWTVAKVAAGGNARLPLQLKAATARNFSVAVEWTVLPQAGIHEIEVKQAELQVALEGPVDVEKDIANVYRLKVSNPGSAVARRVKVQVIAGTQPANQIDVGDLEPGQTELVEMDLIFEKAGRVQIAASGAAEGGLKRDTNIAVAVHQPLLEASLMIPSSVPHGTAMVATVQVKNSGDAAARKLQAGLMLPPGSECTQLPAGMSREGNKLLWNIESLPPGELVTVPIEVTLASPGDHELKFACVYGKNQVTNASAVTNVEAFSDLKLIVNDPVSPSAVGSAVNYEIVVTNRGSREARDVAIVAQFSDGIEPESAAGLKHRVVPGQVLFDSIPRIAAGESVKLKVVARAATAGLHRFRVEVRTEETDAKLVEEEATRFLDSTGRVAAPPSTMIQR